MSEQGASSPKAEMLSERQEQIVDAALRIIATKGSRRFTAQLLAAEVGITGGAIYRHFDGMEAIVDAVVDRIGAILFEDFPPQAPDPLDRLRIFFFHRIRALLTKPNVSHLLLSDHLAQAAGPTQAKRLDGFKRRSRDFVRDCLREARDRDILGGGMSPDAGAVVVLGSILSLSHASARLASRAETERLCGEVWSAIESMLRLPRSTERPMAQPARSRRRSAKE